MSLRRKHNGAQHLEERMSALQSDLSRLQGDFRGLAAAGGEVATDRFNDALTSAEHAADRAVSHLGTWTEGNLETVRDQVRTQPLAALLLSLGAGALVSAFLLRR